jgi:hypothetical protein
MIDGLTRTMLALLLVAICSDGPVRAEAANGTFNPKSEVDEFVNMVDFPKMLVYTQRWSAELPPDQRKQILLELLHRLRNTREGRIENYADMTVTSRVRAGKMRFRGLGYNLEQDIFLVNGRCAWAIDEILGCRLPAFTVEVGQDAKKLDESVEQSFFKVIKAMEMPKKPKPLESNLVEPKVITRDQDFSVPPPATKEKSTAKDEPAKTKTFPKRE